MVQIVNASEIVSLFVPPKLGRFFFLCKEPHHES